MRGHLLSIGFSHRAQVAAMLKNWARPTPEQAMGLLDAPFADKVCEECLYPRLQLLVCQCLHNPCDLLPFCSHTPRQQIRSYAVQLIDTMNDEKLTVYMLQLVQVRWRAARRPCCL
jgi:hypothetical protein